MTQQRENLATQKALFDSVIFSSVIPYDISDDSIHFEIEVMCLDGVSHQYASIEIDDMLSYLEEKDVIYCSKGGKVVTIVSSPTFQDPTGEMGKHTEQEEWLWDCIREHPDIIADAFLPVFLGDSLEDWKESQRKEIQARIQETQSRLKKAQEIINSINVELIELTSIVV